MPAEFAHNHGNQRETAANEAATNPDYCNKSALNCRRETSRCQNTMNNEKQPCEVRDCWYSKSNERFSRLGADFATSRRLRVENNRWGSANCTRRQCYFRSILPKLTSAFISSNLVYQNFGGARFEIIPRRERTNRTRTSARST